MPKAVDPASLLQRAMQAHAGGQIDLARQRYKRLLGRAPQHPDALHLLGVLEAQAGHHARGAALIQQAIQVHPAEAMFHNNLGNVCIETGQFEQAGRCYRQALALDSERPDVANNLGVLLSRMGQAEEAERLWLDLIERTPDFAAVHQNLANHYHRQGRIADAMQVCVDALIVSPRNPTLRRLLGAVYASLGRFEEAAAVYRAWLQEEPDSPEAQFRLTACTGVGVPDRAPDRYVAEIFDTFANSFEAKLAALSYRAPELVAQAVARHVSAPAAQFDVVDAGCGTGLCGPLLKPWARHLVGVDLSEGMLARARPREVYDQLVCSELVAFLGGCTAACDLLVSADTLCYFGALDGFAGAARAALREGGWLVFTVEALADGPDTPGFNLQGHGRYSHRGPYLEAVLGRAGLASVEMQPVVLRMEAGQPVQGWLVVARAGAAHWQP